MYSLLSLSVMLIGALEYAAEWIGEFLYIALGADPLFQRGARHILGLQSSARRDALHILVVCVETDVRREITNLTRLEIACFVLEPTETVGVSLVEHIPEISLRVLPEQVIYLIATARR